MIKIGIVGCGRIAEAHLNALSALQDKFKVVAIFDVDKNRAKHLSDKFSVNVERNLENLLNDTEINLISVTVPDGFHYEVVKKAIQSSKNVLVEKPIALSLEQAEELIHLANNNKIFFGVVLQKRLFNIFRKVKEVVKSGEIGEVFLVLFQQIWYRDDNYFLSSWHGKKTMDGGLILNQSIHNIDLLDWIVGPIEKVTAYGGKVAKKKIETEDTVTSLLKIPHGVGNIALTISAYPGNYGDLFEIFGSKGKIVIGTGSFENLTSDELKNYTMELKNSTLSGYGHRLAYESVYDKIVNKKEGVIDVNNVFHSFKVAFSVRESLETGKEVIIGGK